MEVGEIMGTDARQWAWQWEMVAVLVWMYFLGEVEIGSRENSSSWEGDRVIIWQHVWQRQQKREQWLNTWKMRTQMRTCV